MRNILYDLYSSWEHHPVQNSEYDEINYKIITEMEYFKNNMKSDDSLRLEALECLFTQAGEYEQADVFVAGFKLGVMIMCAVFNDD